MIIVTYKDKTQETFNYGEDFNYDGETFVHIENKEGETIASINIDEIRKVEIK